MKTKLITALRSTATALEDGTFHYSWRDQANCNCGSLFCALTGKSAADLEVPEALLGANPTWETIIGQYCPITGMPTHELFRELFGYGLTQKDMINLEYLRDPKVIARINLKEVPARQRWYQPRTPKPNVREKLDCENKEHVIAYMRAWADLLTGEGALDVATKETEHAQVSYQ